MLNKIAYIRGLIDADGSIGITKTGKPFVSFCTKSEFIKDYYFEFIFNTIGYTPIVNRNQRDSIYNIMIMGSRAQILIKTIYENASIALDRKSNGAKKALLWMRDDTLRKESHPKRWNEEEDKYILSHTITESIISLKRSIKSIIIRKFRLKNNIILSKKRE